MRKACLPYVFALVLAATPSMFGQAASGTSTIGGLVIDPSGAVIPSAEVVVRNVGTNVARTLKSNEAGLYEAVSLQPGEYEVKGSKAGFATLTRKGITVAVGQRAVVDLSMKVSSTSEDVTVVGDVAVVETDKTDVSTVINL